MRPYIVRITNGRFYDSLRQNASPVFRNPIEGFEIKKNEKWAFVGNGRLPMMNALSNKYLCGKSGSRGTVDYAYDGMPIAQLLFKDALPKNHLSARYEYFKDEFDETCKQFVLRGVQKVDWGLYSHLVDMLQLGPLQDRYAMSLSNGQMRRARLAQTLVTKPALAFIEEPFLGLDPEASTIVSRFLANYTYSTIAMILTHVQDVPDWCTHLCVVEDGIQYQGIWDSQMRVTVDSASVSHPALSTSVHQMFQEHPWYGKSSQQLAALPACFELKGLDITYSGQRILKDIHWKVMPGSKWKLSGPNGAGKSTLLAVATAEHPQSWNRRVLDHGMARIPGTTDYFSINKHVGLASPELHSLCLKSAGHLTVRDIIATGFGNNFIQQWYRLDSHLQSRILSFIHHFHLDQNAQFSMLPLSDQKLVLLLRAAIKLPRLLLLDEGLSSMTTETLARSIAWLQAWPGCLIAVSHRPTETPHHDHVFTIS